MGRHAKKLDESKGTCVVHKDEINTFSWCDNFDYCETAIEIGDEYRCHTAKDCADFNCGSHEEET